MLQIEVWAVNQANHLSVFRWSCQTLSIFRQKFYILRLSEASPLVLGKKIFVK